MFWYTAQKDYTTAVLSLIEIARFNGVNFEDKFRETREFLHGKRSKEIQCDFQPLLRLGLLLNQFNLNQMIYFIQRISKH
jgi:hypothetical protein